jgi:hypothetical protein
MGLASLGQITYNPVTGLPEAFSLKGIFKSIRKLAPIALAIAAPYAFGATTALGIGASTALGSFAGNIIAGAKAKDALKAGLFSGLTAGVGSYLGGAASGIGGAAGQTGGQVGTQAIGQTVGPGAMGAGGFGQATQSAGNKFFIRWWIKYYASFYGCKRIWTSYRCRSISTFCSFTIYYRISRKSYYISFSKSSFTTSYTSTS